jgi:hypothetical protein
MSLEQQSEFVIIRRILRAVCPEYVIYTKSGILPGTSVLDNERKTIVISDDTDVPVAIAAALFQIGKLRIRLKIPGGDQHSEEFLRDMARALHRHDKSAAAWAFTSYLAFWPSSDPESIQKILKSYIVSSFDWFQFIRS